MCQTLHVGKSPKEFYKSIEYVVGHFHIYIYIFLQILGLETQANVAIAITTQALATAYTITAGIFINHTYVKLDSHFSCVAIL